MAFDASPSWSGFNYQGKIALYYAVKMINEKPAGADLSNYSLMLESTEDFEIQCVGTPISIHQVKAYNTSSYSEYSDALIGLTLELHKWPDVKGKIHTWKPIHSKPGRQNLTESIRDDISTILDRYKNRDANGGTTILEKAASPEKGICKTAAILRAAFKGKTADQIFTVLDSILNGQNDALSRLTPYKYDDDNLFCDLDEINNKIKSEISNYMISKTKPTTHEQLDKSFLYFLGLMDRHIIKRHKNKQECEKIPISFDEIIRALDYDHENVGNEYLALQFKEQFVHSIDEYMGDQEDYQEPEDNAYCNLKEARKWLLGLTPQDLWAHYRSFSPHVYLQHDNNTVNALHTDIDGIRNVLIGIFHTINFERASHKPEKYRLTYCSTGPGNQHYLPTTIGNNARPSQIEKKIRENPSMSEVVFEVENLIYKGSEPHSFSPTLMVHTEAPTAEDSDPRPKRDEPLKTITLVPIPTAKDELA